jgi:hypothetical protein
MKQASFLSNNCNYNNSNLNGEVYKLARMLSLARANGGVPCPADRLPVSIRISPCVSDMC